MLPVVKYITFSGVIKNELFGVHPFFQDFSALFAVLYDLVYLKNKDEKNIGLLFISIFCNQISARQGVAVNSDGTAPHSSAMLDVKSTNKGMLVPRVSLLSPTDAVTIPFPANSLLVYNTNVNKAQMPDGEGFYYWDINIWRLISPLTKENISTIGYDAFINI